jgi:hypothetical protein
MLTHAGRLTMTFTAQTPQIAVCLLLTFAACTELHGQSKAFFFFDARLGKTSGSTQYNIKGSEYSDELQATASFESELIFPANHYFGAFAVGMMRPVTEDKSLQLILSFTTGLNNTTGVMRDTDWLRVPAFRYDEVVSLTESSANSKNYVIELNSRVGPLLKSRLQVLAILGYRYQSSDYKIIGAKGWQYDDNGNRVNITLSGEVLRYKIRYHIPYMGLAASAPLSERITFRKDAGYCFCVCGKNC